MSRQTKNLIRICTKQKEQKQKTKNEIFYCIELVSIRMASVAFNQELLTSWVNLCQAHGDARRSGADPATTESLRVQVAVSLVALLQSSSMPMTEQASLNLLIHLLENREPTESSDPSDPQTPHANSQTD